MREEVQLNLGSSRSPSLSSADTPIPYLREFFNRKLEKESSFKESKPCDNPSNGSLGNILGKKDLSNIGINSTGMINLTGSKNSQIIPKFQMKRQNKHKFKSKHSEKSILPASKYGELEGCNIGGREGIKWEERVWESMLNWNRDGEERRGLEEEEEIGREEGGRVFHKYFLEDLKVKREQCKRYGNSFHITSMRHRNGVDEGEMGSECKEVPVESLGGINKYGSSRLGNTRKSYLYKGTHEELRKEQMLSQGRKESSNSPHSTSMDCQGHSIIPITASRGSTHISHALNNLVLNRYRRGRRNPRGKEKIRLDVTLPHISTDASISPPDHNSSKKNKENNIKSKIAGCRGEGRYKRVNESLVLPKQEILDQFPFSSSRGRMNTNTHKLFSLESLSSRAITGNSFLFTSLDTDSTNHSPNCPKGRTGKKKCISLPFSYLGYKLPNNSKYLSVDGDISSGSNIMHKYQRKLPHVLVNHRLELSEKKGIMRNSGFSREYTKKAPGAERMSSKHRISGGGSLKILEKSFISRGRAKHVSNSGERGGTQMGSEDLIWKGGNINNKQTSTMLSHIPFSNIITTPLQQISNLNSNLHFTTPIVTANYLPHNASLSKNLNTTNIDSA